MVTKPPAIETPGWCSLLFGYCRRGDESGEGGLKYDTRQGRFWHCEHSSNDDQGTFSPLLY